MENKNLIDNLIKKSNSVYQGQDGYYLLQPDMLYKKKWAFVPFEKTFDEDQLSVALLTLKSLNEIEVKKLN